MSSSMRTGSWATRDEVQGRQQRLRGAGGLRVPAARQVHPGSAGLASSSGGCAVGRRSRRSPAAPTTAAAVARARAPSGHGAAASAPHGHDDRCRHRPPQLRRGSRDRGLASTGEIGLATVLIIGFALHNATEGFGIVGPLGDVRPSWRWLGAGRTDRRRPTFFGSVSATRSQSEPLELPSTPSPAERSSTWSARSGRRCAATATGSSACLLAAGFTAGWSRISSWSTAAVDRPRRSRSAATA